MLRIFVINRSMPNPRSASAWWWTCITLFAAFAGNIDQKAHGTWDVAVGSSPDAWAEKGVWIDVLVDNLAADKVVGIVWTDNNWSTNNVSYLTYEYNAGNNKEQWGLDFAPMGRLDSYYIGGWSNYITGTVRAGGVSTTVEYAVFVEANGQTYWDNNQGQNYTLQLGL